MKHLEPWMPWATLAAADVATQRSRIAQADGMWEAGREFIYTVLPGDTAADGGPRASLAGTVAGAPPEGTAVAGGPASPGGAPRTPASGGSLPGPDFLGAFGLHRRIGPDGIEMGYWIHADRAGRGYGTAAARALTRVALALPGVARVEIHCDAANVASAAIPRRLGYRLSHTEKRTPQAPGETGQLMIWVLEGERPQAARA